MAICVLQMQENKRLKGLVEDMKMEKPPDMVETAFVVSFKKTKTAMEKVQKVAMFAFINYFQ